MFIEIHGLVALIAGLCGLAFCVWFSGALVVSRLVSGHWRAAIRIDVVAIAVCLAFSGAGLLVDSVGTDANEALDIAVPAGLLVAGIAWIGAAYRFSGAREATMLIGAMAVHAVVLLAFTAAS